MKKILLFLLSAALLLCLCACGVPKRDSDRLQVVATLFPQYDFARNIAGERADVTLLLDFGVDAHSYDPTPMDLITVAEADLFLYTGDAMELWAAKLLASPDVARAVESGSLTVLDLSQFVEPVCIGEHDHDHGHDHEHEEADPHIWTSVENADRMSVAIAEALTEIDPAGAEDYRVSLSAYRAMLASLSADYALLTPVRDTAYFGGSFAFAYLFDSLGLSHKSVFNGCASHAEATAGDVAGIVDAMRESGARYVLYDNLSEQKTARTIAAETGAEVLRLHAIHNITKAEFDAGENYFSLMLQNRETLRKALGE